MTALSAGTLEQAVDDILDINPAPVAIPTTLLDRTDSNQWNTYVASVQWWMDRMVDSPKPLQEKMTMFWHGHFVSSKKKINETYLLMDQNTIFRDNAVGSFRDIATKVAVDPAMLLYLDNTDNTKWSPNENFGRELLELFLLGIGNYAESDVEAAAHAWTGHGVNWTAGSSYLSYVFTLDNHDTANKTFMGVTRNWNGPEIVTHILDVNTTARLNAARLIVAKLWEYFAHPGIPTAVRDTLVTGFMADWQIKPLLRAMFLRTEFYTTAAKQGLTRTPTDYTVALMASTGLRAAAMHPDWYMDAMGQVPLSPPDVSGWKANAYFINTSTMSARAEMVRQITWTLRQNGGYDSVATMTIPAAITFLSDLLYLTPLSTASSNALAGFLTAQRAATPNYHSWWEATNLLSLAMLVPEMHAA